MHHLYVLPIALFNCERCKELFLLFLMTKSLWLYFVRDVIMIPVIFLEAS